MANAPEIARGDEEASSPSDVIEVLERELARSYRIERALRDVGLALGATLDLDALLRLILERTTEALEAERATLFLLEQRPTGALQTEPVLVSRVTEGGAVDEIALRLGEGIAGEVARTGQVANVRDAYEDPRFSRAWDERSGFRTRAVLCVPLKSQLGRIVGVIQVLNKRPGAGPGDRAWSSPDDAFFDEDDEALLQALATQAAVSIEQARLFVSILDKNRELSAARAALEKKVQDLNVLFAIERATARAGTREDLALAILPEATRAVGGRTAFVVLADESGDLTLLHVESDAVDLGKDATLAPPERGSWPAPSAAPPSVNPARSAAGVSPLRRLRIKAGEGLVGEAISRGVPVVVPDVAADPRRSERIRRALFARGDDAGAPAAILPFLNESDDAFGALAVIRRPGDPPFAEDDVDLLRLLALNASTGFQLEAAREARAREERLTTIGSLLSGMMHDLKTPMTVIGGYVHLMAEETDPEQRAAYAELVHKQFDHIAAMQREILAFARGERTVLLRKVYLQKFFADIEQQLRHEIERRRADVELVVDLKDRGTVRLDEAKITRAVHNLARNAIEAMGDRGGRLTITVDQVPGNLVIRVADTGPGLPPEVEERLFQSFVTSGKATGTGLGLAIVKKIAEDHGGAIEAASTPQGATFTLRIPQDASNPALKRMPTGAT